MDAKEIKKRLTDDDRLERVLEELGCEYIKREQRGGLVTAMLPERFNSTNKRAVQVYVNEAMPAKIRNISGFSGDIFSLVAFLQFKAETSELQDKFKESINFIADIFGWSISSGNAKRKRDYTTPLKLLASKSKKFAERVPNEPIDEKVLSDFKTIPSHEWYEEGISLKTQEFYEVGFDYLTHRITIPIRNEKGELVGVKGRLINNNDVTDFNPKYMYIYRCNMSQEWFNMYVARAEIIRKRKVYIFEAEKSVLKLHSNGIHNALAISSSDISEPQVTMIKNLGLDIDIVLCYDKDKTAKEVKETAKKFTNRNVYAIADTKDLLDEKDSPIDKGIEVWNKLEENHCYHIVKVGQK